MEDLRTYFREDTAGDEMFYVEVESPASTCPEGTTRYVLRAGDTLASVAARFNITPQQLFDANPAYNPGTYRAGSSLCVPIPSEASQCPTAQLYRVRAGDTVEAVLQHFQVTREALYQLNPSVAVHGLVPGELICIPTKTQKPDTQPMPAIPLNPPLPTPNVPQTPLEPAKPVIPAPMPTPTPVKPVPQVPLNPPAPSRPAVPVRPPETVLPVVPEVPLAPCPGGGERITVREGDTLGQILIGYNIAYAASNPGVNLRKLQAGQSLCVPPSGSRGNCRTCTDMYTMGQGENLTSVARARRRPVEDLLAWNPTLLPSDFASGQRICLS